MRGRDWIGIFLSLGIIGLDQVTKWMVDHGIKLHESIPIIPGFLSLTHVRNTGAAFGFFSQASPMVSSVFLSVFSGVAIALLLIFWIRSRRADGIMVAGLALILGGAIGNLVDRIRLGEVIDFMDVHWRNLHWPAFNVADSAITVGVTLLLVHLLLSSRHASSR